MSSHRYWRRQETLDRFRLLSGALPKPSSPSPLRFEVLVSAPASPLSVLGCPPLSPFLISSWWVPPSCSSRTGTLREEWACARCRGGHEASNRVVDEDRGAEVRGGECVRSVSLLEFVNCLPGGSFTASFYGYWLGTDRLFSEFQSVRVVKFGHVSRRPVV